MKKWFVGRENPTVILPAATGHLAGDSCGYLLKAEIKCAQSPWGQKTGTFLYMKPTICDQCPPGADLDDVFVSQPALR